jgi:carboxyl-terminal processing protease
MRYLPAALVAVLAVICLTPTTAQAQKKPQKVDCHKDLKEAAELIDAMWSFKIFKPGVVDINAVYAQLAPEAKRSTTPEACAGLLERFMATLHDGHSSLRYFPGVERTRPAIEVRSQRERLSRIPGEKPPVHAYVVSRDTTGQELRPILPGSEILAVDGVPVDSLYRSMEDHVSGSTVQWRDYMCDRRLLRGPPESTVELTLRVPGGGEQTVVLQRPPIPTEEESKREAEIFRDTVRIATWRRLDGGWGYLKYTTFSFGRIEETLEPFDNAVDSLLDAPGLIIDLRGNGGGYVDAMTGTAGRFVTERFPVEYFQIREPGQELVIEVWDPYTGSPSVKPSWMAKPRGKAYTGPLVILIDHRCFSACEGFTAGLQAIDRALVIGSSASGGGSGAVGGLKLPSGAIISFSYTVGWRPDGEQVEGNGVNPDILVRERPQDWRAGRDRVLERAIKALEAGEAKSAQQVAERR